MRTRRSFLVDDEATAFEALRRHGFATLISVGDDGRLYAPRLATILRRDRARRTRLWSHIYRRNQQAEPLRGDRGSPVGQQSRIAELMRCELHGRGAYSELEPISLAPCALLDPGGEG